MFKGVSFILGTLIFASVACAHAAEKECKKETPLDKNLSDIQKVATLTEVCPDPDRVDFNELCDNIHTKKVSSDESELSYKYQEYLWKISCAKDGVDNLETARKKIQTMWNKNRASMSCDFPGQSVPRGNIAKASLETNFSYFLFEAVRDYKLDMNFKDPVDNRTILDFIKDQIALFKKSPTDMNLSINEYEGLYKLLKDNGAKHSKDL